MEKITLGKTGLEVTKVGFGVLTMGETQLNLSEEKGAELISYARSKGINFFDTAEYYNTYHYMAKAFNGNTDGLVISSKSLSESAEGMINAVEEARKALNRDVIDIFLMHEIRGMWDFSWRKKAYAALLDLKAKGVVKAIGVSTHHIDVCEAMADIPEIDVVFPLINYKGLGIRKGDDAGTASEMAAAIAKCAAAGKGVYGMKAFGGGNLTGSYIEALDYVYGLEGIESMMIGFGKKHEIDNICDYLDGKLPKDFTPDIRNKKIHIDQGDCEGCGSCVQRCNSAAISINKNTGVAEIDHSKCVTCGYCAPVCPVRAIIMIDY